MNLTLERESMLIYKSFIDVSENLSDHDYRMFWDAIHKYGVYGKDIPTFENPTLNALMTLIEPIIKANIKNYINGSKGGAPKGNTNAKKTTQKQPTVENGLNNKTTQKQGNVNVTVTDNVTATDTDNDTDTANVNVNKKEICPYVDEKGIITDWDKFHEWKRLHPDWKGVDD